jgi:hypothetical protein
MAYLENSHNSGRARPVSFFFWKTKNFDMMRAAWIIAEYVCFVANPDDGGFWGFLEIS